MDILNNFARFLRGLKNKVPVKKVKFKWYYSPRRFVRSSGEAVVVKYYFKVI